MQPHGTASFDQNAEGLSIYEQNTRAVRSNSPSWLTEFTGQCLLSRRAIKQFLKSTDLQAAAPRAGSYWQVVAVLSKSFHQTSCSEQNLSSCLQELSQKLGLKLSQSVHFISKENQAERCEKHSQEQIS